MGSAPRKRLLARLRTGMAWWIYVKHRGALNIEEFRRTSARRLKK
jgi:hypothetical protein